MPPKMLTSTAATAARAKHRPRGPPATTSARAPPPMSQKSAALAAGGGDLVDGAHHEAGAVADDADVAVERDEREPGRARLGLALVLRPAPATHVRLPEEGVVVDRHLAVEADDLAGGREHQRVDLDQRRVAVAVERQSARHDRRPARRRRRCPPGWSGPELRRGHHVAHLVVAEAEQRVDRAAHGARRGRARASSSMSTPPSRGEDEHRAAHRARDGDARGTSRARCRRPARRAPTRPLWPRMVMARMSAAAASTSPAVAQHADAAGLAAAAGLDLRLDDHGQPEPLGRAASLLRRRRHERRQHRQPGRGEQVLALVFEQVHRGQSTRSRRRAWPASPAPPRPAAARGRTPAR